MEEHKKQDVENSSNISEHFCNYNQALALKELAFDEPCFGFYYRKEIDLFGSCKIQDRRNSSYIKDYMDKEDCAAPLKSQVFKWFRDNYKIQGYVYSYTVRGGSLGQDFSDYIYVINGIGMDVIQTDARDSQFGTYEEAESACIDKLIELIKEKKLYDCN